MARRGAGSLGSPPKDTCRQRIGRRIKLTPLASPKAPLIKAAEKHHRRKAREVGRSVLGLLWVSQQPWLPFSFFTLHFRFLLLSRWSPSFVYGSTLFSSSLFVFLNYR